MDAETAYLFRHTLLRDAAYQLQLPGDRGRLHGLALEILERESESTLDALASELAEHALQAQQARGADKRALRVRQLEFLLRAARYARDNFWNSAAMACLDRIAAHPEADAPTRVNALRDAGNVLRMTWATGAAVKYYRRALKLAERLKDKRQLGLVLNGLGSALQESGRARPALKALRRALPLLRSAGDRASEAAVLGTINTTRFNMGEVAAAEKGYRPVLRIFSEINDEAGRGRALVSLATVINWQARYAEAEPLYREALEILRKHDDLHYLGITLMNLAALYAETNRKALAEPVFKEALALNERVGNRKLVGFTLGNLARLTQELGRNDESLRWLARAREVLELLGDTHEIAAIVDDLNSVRGKRGLPLLAG